jgi:uncharacterized protein DUF1924
MISWKTVFVAAPLCFAAGLVVAAEGRDAILATYLAQAKKDNPAIAAFSAERGAAFFRAKHAGGQPDTPSCTTCHGSDPKLAGQARTGKPIDPMAVSKNPSRFTDLATVEKWFGRNCKGVLGRECSAAEKGDFIAFQMAQ